MDIKGGLISSVCMSSLTHTYSIITEVIRKWFLHKFNDGAFFKTIYTEEQHVLGEFRNFKEIKEMLKKPKPCLAIVPRISLDFQRDGFIDQNPFGLEYIVQHSDLKNAFFRDYDKDLYIGTSFKEIELKYNFKIKLETRSQQIDLYNYMNMAFKVGFREQFCIDADFHVSYGLMVQLARDNNFEISSTGNIVNIVGFLNYFNSKSGFPCTFKLRTINGRTEFFVRCKDVEVIIDALEGMTYDDGENIGMLTNNYNIEFPITVHTAAPRYFMYFSNTEHDIPVISTNDTANMIHAVYDISMANVPKTNTNGWNLFITTEYFEENFVDGLSIDLSELIDCSPIGTLFKKITYRLDPNGYCEVKLLNGEKFKTCAMNWNTNVLTVTETVNNPNSLICIYYDLDYINNTLIELEKINETRTN